MANSSCTVTTSPVFYGGADEIKKTLTYLSDETDGSCPDQALYNLKGYYIKEIKTTPSTGGTIPEDTYSVRVNDADDAKIYSGPLCAVDATERWSGHAGTNEGQWPYIDGTITVQIVADDDDTAAADIGNENIIEVELTFKKI